MRLAPQVEDVLPVRLPGGRKAYLFLPMQFSERDAEIVCEWVHLQVDPIEPYNGPERRNGLERRAPVDIYGKPRDPRKDRRRPVVAPAKGER